MFSTVLSILLIIKMVMMAHHLIVMLIVIFPVYWGLITVDCYVFDYVLYHSAMSSVICCDFNDHYDDNGCGDGDYFSIVLMIHSLLCI